MCDCDDAAAAGVARVCVCSFALEKFETNVLRHSEFALNKARSPIM